jgi:ABC-2 type transport system permease protein
MMILSVTTIFCLVPAVVAMAIGLGAIYPDFKSENPALSVTSFGGLLFMLCCFGLIILVIILEAGPVYYLFMAMMRSQNLSVLQIIWTVISFALVLFLCTIATLYPMRMGEKSLQIK